MTFTTDAVTEVLHKIVAEKGPDYVYPGTREIYAVGCNYADREGNPSCIVGHVIAALEPGVFQEIAQVEKDEEGSFGAQEALEGHAYGYDENGDEPQVTPTLTFDAMLVNALQLAQTAQDGGLTWGDAVSYYDRFLAGEDGFGLQQEVNIRINALKCDIRNAK